MPKNTSKIKISGQILIRKHITKFENITLF